MIKKRIVSILILVQILFASAFGQTRQKNFTGEWTLNPSKSSFGQLTADHAAAKSLNIIAKNDEIQIARVFASTATKDIYSLSGNEISQDLPNETTKKSFLKIMEDSSMIVKSKYRVENKNNGEPWEYTRSEIYSLSSNGKTLTLERVTVLPDRTETVKAVYDKILSR